MPKSKPSSSSSLNPSAFLPSFRDIEDFVGVTSEQNDVDCDAEPMTKMQLLQLDTDLGLARPTKKQRRAQESMAILPPELYKKMGEANSHYIEQQYQEAATILLEVIREAPHVAAPYNTLGLVFEELNRPVDALKVFILAAHFTPKDTVVWKRLVDMAEQHNETDQIVYCLSKLIRMNSDDCESMWKRALIYEKMGDIRRAIDGLQRMNLKQPQNTQCVKKLGQLLFQVNKHGVARQVLESYLEYARSKITETSCDSNHTLWDLTIVNMLCEIYMPESLFELAQSLIEETKSHMISNDHLPIELNIRLLLCHLHCRVTQDPSDVLNAIGKVDVNKFSELFLEAADSLADLELHEAALKCIESIEDIDEYANSDVWIRQARSLAALPNAHQQAIDKCRSILISQPGELEASIILSELLRKNGDNTTSIELLEAAGLRLVRESMAREESGKPLLAIDENKIRLLHYTSELYMQEQQTERLLELCLETVMYTLTALTTSHKEEQNESEQMLLGRTRSHRPRHLPIIFHDGYFLGIIINVLRCLALYKRFDEASDLITLAWKMSWHENKKLESAATRLRTLGISILFNANRFGYTYSQLSMLIPITSDTPLVVNVLALVLKRMLYPDKCRRFLERSIKKIPHSVGLRVLLAHASTLKRTFARACKEYLHAFILSPFEPNVVLYTAVSLLQQAWSPSNLNPNQTALHGITLIYRYVKLRKQSIDAIYNLACAFHLLGINHIAIHYYQQVLKKIYASNRHCVTTTDTDCDKAPLISHDGNDLIVHYVSSVPQHLARETAHNLSLLYMRSGSIDLARRVLLQNISF